MKMSHFKDAIIPFLKVGNYGKKGYFPDKPERIKEIECNT